MNINLHIKQLILNGVKIPFRQHHLMHSSMETELARLLTDGKISTKLARGTALPCMPIGKIQLTDNNPTQIGRKIARSIYEGISHE